MLVRTQMILALLLLTACTQPQQTTANSAVVQGQLYCSLVTKTGPLVVALADASGVPVVATDKAASVVQAACAVIGAIPVAPPPTPSQAPVVAAPVAAAARSA